MGRTAIAATKSFRRDYAKMNKSDKQNETKEYRFEFEDIFGDKLQKGIDWISAKTDSQALNKFNRKHPKAILITWGSFDRETFGKPTVLTGLI